MCKKKDTFIEKIEDIADILYVLIDVGMIILMCYVGYYSLGRIDSDDNAINAVCIAFAFSLIMAIKIKLTINEFKHRRKQRRWIQSIKKGE